MTYKDIINKIRLGVSEYHSAYNEPPRIIYLGDKEREALYRDITFYWSGAEKLMQVMGIEIIAVNRRSHFGFGDYQHIFNHEVQK